jgi:hypothetical protein
MQVATFGEGTAWSGTAIEYVDGVFTAEDHGELTAQEVQKLGRQGDLVWASDAAPFWLAAVVHARPARRARTPLWVWVASAAICLALIAALAGVVLYFRDASETPRASAPALPAQYAASMTDQTQEAWVSVLDWSGGGRGERNARSGTFEVRGGEQQITLFWRRVGRRSAGSALTWNVVAADGHVLETVTSRAVGASTSTCSLPEGTYFLSGRNADSIWNVAVSDYR